MLVANDSDELTWTLVTHLVQELDVCDVMARVQHSGHSRSGGGQAFAVESPRIS